MREGSGIRVVGSMVANWIVQRGCQMNPLAEGPAPVVVDVVVPRFWTAEVIAQAEWFCQQAAKEMAS